MEVVNNKKSVLIKARSFSKTTDVPKSQDATINERKNSYESKNPGVSSNTSESKNTNVANEINLVVDLNSNNLIQGLIMSEILGRPKAKKSRGNTIWNSRF